MEVSSKQLHGLITVLTLLKTLSQPHKAGRVLMVCASFSYQELAQQSAGWVLPEPDTQQQGAGVEPEFLAFSGIPGSQFLSISQKAAQNMGL